MLLSTFYFLLSTLLLCFLGVQGKRTSYSSCLDKTRNQILYFRALDWHCKQGLYRNSVTPFGIETKDDMKDFHWFSHHVKSVCIRNLFPATETPFKSLPSPQLSLKAVRADGSAGTSVCDDALQRSTVNPVWTILTKTEASADDKLTQIQMIVKDAAGAAAAGDDNTILDMVVDLDQLVYLGNVIADDLHRLPYNAVLITAENNKLWTTYSTSLEMKTIETTGAEPDGVATESESEDDENSSHSQEKFDDDNAPGSRAGLSAELQAVRVELSNSSAAVVAAGGGGGAAAGAAAASTDAVASFEYRHKLKSLEELKNACLAAEALGDEEEAAFKEEHALLKDTTDLQSHVKHIESLQLLMKGKEEQKERLRELGTKTRFFLEARQLKLLSELQTIYPIEPYWPTDDKAKADGSGGQADQQHNRVVSATSHSSKTSRWAIRGVALPSLDCHAKDEEQLNTVLGYIVHVVVLLSKYQSINLRYQLLYYSSRSMVRDPTANGTSNQNLPLYKSSSVEPERFARAVMWLSKDIEQILLIRGLEYQRSKDILFNLHQVFKNELIPHFS